MALTMFSLGMFLVTFGLLMRLPSLISAGPCDPGQQQQSAVFLPQSSLCLVPVVNKKSWLAAQTACEAELGTLYQLPADGQLTGNSGLLGQCLSAMPASASLQDSDLWMGVVSNYSRQWFWVNDTLLNPIRYVTEDLEAFEQRKDVQMCSNYLSIDYCVMECHTMAAAYTVLHFQKAYPCCFCSFRVAMNKLREAASPVFDALPRTSTYYVAQAGEGSGNLIRLFASEAFSETDTLCATVDTATVTTREITSKTCFSEFPFICSLGTSPSLTCDSVNCQSTLCRLRVGEECLQRDSRRMTWFRALAECRGAGGDLWTPGRLDDLHQVHLALRDNTQYWVGALNHRWHFQPESVVFGSSNPDFQLFRCGHMFVEKAGDDSRQWLWSDTRCDQQKAYICQFSQTIYTAATTDKEVICPWEITTLTPPASQTVPISPTATVTSSNTNNINTSIISNTSSIINGTYVTEGSLYATGSEYPIIPIIAAAIAAATILVCAILVLGCSRRRRWLLKKMQRSRDYVWPFWAASPTILSPSHTSFDSMSTGHTGMHSDSGSVFHSGAFVFPDPAYPAEGGGADRHHAHYRPGSRARDDLSGRVRIHGRASITSGASRKDGIEEGAAVGDGERSSQTRGEAVPSTSSAHGDTVASLKDAYSPSSPRNKEYMTLSAHMNIQEDSESRYSSLRRRPEVALVTNDVDLNFTVNHAYPVSHAHLLSHAYPRSVAAERLSDRGVDEIDLPLESTLEIPTRAVEESVLYY